MHELLEKRERLSEQIEKIRFLPTAHLEVEALMSELRRLDLILDEIEFLPPLQKMDQTPPFARLLIPFKNYLEEGYQALQIGKKRGLFDYIFGRHPKVVLSICLYEAEKEIPKLLDYIKKEERYLSWFQFLTLFREEINRAWNPSLYGRKFLELYEEFQMKWVLLNQEMNKNSS